MSEAVLAIQESQLNIIMFVIFETDLRLLGTAWQNLSMEANASLPIFVGLASSIWTMQEGENDDDVVGVLLDGSILLEFAVPPNPNWDYFREQFKQVHLKNVLLELMYSSRLMDWRKL